MVAFCRGCTLTDLRRLCPATVVLTGLEPNTTYEVRVAAVNGKGQGEFSHTETFQTLPIRELPCSSHPMPFKIKAFSLSEETPHMHEHFSHFFPLLCNAVTWVDC